MKRSLLLIPALALALLSSCYTEDKKNEAEPYPTTDTTKMEHINDSASTNVTHPSAEMPNH